MSWPKKDGDTFVGNMGDEMEVRDGCYCLKGSEYHGSNYTPGVLPKDHRGRATSASRPKKRE
jgi:hypothetical protein